MPLSFCLHTCFYLIPAPILLFCVHFHFPGTFFIATTQPNTHLRGTFFVATTQPHTHLHGMLLFPIHVSFLNYHIEVEDGLAVFN